MSHEDLLNYLQAQQFRNLLLESYKGSEFHRQILTDVTRLIAAYFLDLPLFVPKLGENLPSLFVWCELKKDDFPPSATRLSRSDVSNRLSPEFGPKFAAVMLAHLGLSLEAILYSDYFNDHRTALVLRIYADSMYGFSLVSDHCFAIVNQQVPAEISRIVTSSRDAKTDIGRFGPAVVRSLFELDIVFNTTLILDLETIILEKIELSFAELTVNSSDDDVRTLPRPPVYLLPNLAKIDGSEARKHLEIHLYIQLFLQCLHQTNRLNYELQMVQAALAQYDLQFQDDLSSSAAKYKSLLAESEDEDDRKALDRWFSLAEDQDLQHVSAFIEYLTKNFKQSTLPSFRSATREIWLDNLLENSKRDTERHRPNSSNECDWLMGHIRCETKVDAHLYREMHFISSSWSVLPTVDRSLIALRLSVLPSDLCISKIEETFKIKSNDYSLNFPSHTTEEASELPLKYSEIQPGPSRKRDLISEYARKGEELFGKRHVTQLTTNQVSKIEMNRNLWERLRKVQQSQKQIANELEEEKSFIESVDSERPRTAHEYSLNSSFNKDLDVTVLLEQQQRSVKKFGGKVHTIGLPDKVQNLQVLPSTWTQMRKKDAKIRIEHSLHEDLSKLNEKLEEFNKVFYSRESSSVSESQMSEREINNSANEDEAPDGESHTEDLVEDLEADPIDDDDPFNVYDVAHIAKSLPEIEKLDFSQLSPPPDVGKRSFAFSAKGPNSARSLRTDFKPQKVLQLPEWMRLIPLEKPTSVRMPLLKHDLSRQYSKTERGCQTSPKESTLKRHDSGYHSGPSLKKLEFVREMSHENITNLLNAVRTT